MRRPACCGRCAAGFVQRKQEFVLGKWMVAGERVPLCGIDIAGVAFKGNFFLHGWNEVIPKRKTYCPEISPRAYQVGAGAAVVKMSVFACGILQYMRGGGVMILVNVIGMARSFCDLRLKLATRVYGLILHVVLAAP